MKNDKFIDGIRPRANSIDGVSAAPPRRRVVAAQRPVKKVTPSTRQVGFDREQVRKVASSEKVRRERQDFIKPVKAFDFDLDSDDLATKRKKTTAGRPGSLGQKAEKAKKKKKLSTGKKVAIIIVIILAVLVGAAFIWGNEIIAKLTGGNSNIFDAISTIVTEKVPPLKTGENGRANILMFGTSGYEMSGSGHDGSQLADSIMLLSIDQENGDAAMVSLPRDLYVGTCTSTGKVNEVYWCANPQADNEEAGASAMMAKVGEILGQEIQYYAHVDWGALVQIVDALGGITVTLDEDINDSWTGTYIQAGVPVTLDGEQALGLARARHGTESGDFTRGNSQQKILIGIQDKIVKDGLDFGQILNLVNILGDNLRTNFTTDDIKSLYTTFKDFSLANMRQAPLLGTAEGNLMTTGTINGISYVLPSAGRSNYSQIQKYVANQFSSDPILREGAKITVLNGSQEVGVAGAERNSLEEAGFIVAGVGDVEGEYTERYYIYDLSEGGKPGTLAKLMERYGISAEAVLPKTAWGNQVYTYGADFIVVIGVGNTASAE